jgi:ABC-2 type transport system ATP-binding protein
MITIRVERKRLSETFSLRDIDLVIPDNSMFGFLGPNGAGKTTLIRLVLGLYQPDIGFIDHGGENVRVAAVLDHHGLFEDISVLDNLLYYAQLYGMRPRREELLSAMKEFELESETTRPARHLSSGMKQRAALLRAFFLLPHLLVLDEPTKNLDIEHKAAIHELLLKHQRERGVTTIIASHDLYEISKLCGEGVLISGGRIVGQLDRETLAHPQQIESRYLEAVHAVMA